MASAQKSSVSNDSNEPISEMCEKGFLSPVLLFRWLVMETPWEQLRVGVCVCAGLGCSINGNGRVFAEINRHLVYWYAARLMTDIYPVTCESETWLRATVSSGISWLGKCVILVVVHGYCLRQHVMCTSCVGRYIVMFVKWNVQKNVYFELLTQIGESLQRWK